MNDQKNEEAQEWLLAISEVTEQPFRSTAPIIGPLIVRLRTLWLNMAARWYVRPMVGQQNRFNRLLVERLREYEAYTYEITAEQDHDLSYLKHDLAVVQTQIRGLRRQLLALDEQLARIEGAQDKQGKGDGG